MNLDFQAVRNNTNVMINLILMKAKGIKMNVILVIPQSYFLDADCCFALTYFEIPLGRIRI